MLSCLRWNKYNNTKTIIVPVFHLVYMLSRMSLCLLHLENIFLPSRTICCRKFFAVVQQAGAGARNALTSLSSKSFPMTETPPFHHGCCLWQTQTNSSACCASIGGRKEELLILLILFGVRGLPGIHILQCPCLLSHLLAIISILPVLCVDVPDKMLIISIL